MVLTVGLMAAMVAGGCSPSPSEKPAAKPEEPTGPHAVLLKLFPKSDSVMGWKMDGAVKIYGPAMSLADAVEPLQADLPNDAAAFQGYSYRKSGTARFTGPQPGEQMTVRIFEMESPSEAFGIFSVLAKGKLLSSVGLAAREGPSALQFVKGNYFVWIEHGGTGPAMQAMKDFAVAVADQVKSPGYRPSILA
jgi:hypothetical protein